MDLATIKKREDLNAKLVGLHQQLAARRKEKEQEAVTQAATAFHEYFSKNGFIASPSSGNKMTATYGTAVFELETNLGPQGTQLTLKRPSKPEILVRLVHKGYTGPSTTIHAGNPDPIKQLEQQISDAEQALSGAAPQLVYLPAEKITLLAGQRSPSQQPKKTFETFNDLLAEVCA